MPTHLHLIGSNADKTGLSDITSAGYRMMTAIISLNKDCVTQEGSALHCIPHEGRNPQAILLSDIATGFH